MFAFSFWPWMSSLYLSFSPKHRKYKEKKIQKLYFSGNEHNQCNAEIAKDKGIIWPLNFSLRNSTLGAMVEKGGGEIESLAQIPEFALKLKIWSS